MPLRVKILAGFAVPLTLLTVSASRAADPQGSARQEVLAHLNDPEVDVRRQAITELGTVGVPGDDVLLLAALRDPDLESAKLAETAIWELWGHSGDEEVDAIFNRGTDALNQGLLATSVELFTEAIKRKPAFAEAWNKRATAYFIMGDYKRSLKDCDEVMKRNPKHFGALAGYGQIYLHLEEPTKALKYLERALEINPNLDGVSELIDEIQAQLEKRRAQTI
jgi:tetratricopeptide (TPR) repeat protein